MLSMLSIREHLCQHTHLHAKYINDECQVVTVSVDDVILVWLKIALKTVHSHQHAIHAHSRILC